VRWVPSSRRSIYLLSAFYDNKVRKDDEKVKIASAFVISREISYKGMEALLSSEIPADRLWQFLQNARTEDAEGRLKIPAARPSDEAQIKAHALAVLKSMKGAGGAAELIDLCDLAEIPKTIRDFMTEVYAKFPRPSVADIADDESTEADSTEEPPAPEGTSI